MPLGAKLQPSRFAGITAENVSQTSRDSVEKEDGRDLFPIAPRTKTGRIRVLKHFNDFRRKFLHDRPPLEFWLQFLKHSPDRRTDIQTLLRFYVKSSIKLVPSLRREGHEMKQMLMCSSSLNTVWKVLIAAADAEYLRPYRLSDVDNNMWAVLVRPKNVNGSLDQGPAMAVSQWIFSREGKELMNLEQTQRR